MVWSEENLGPTGVVIWLGSGRTSPDQRQWLEIAFAPLGERFEIGSRGEEGPAMDQWLAQGPKDGN